MIWLWVVMGTAVAGIGSVLVAALVSRKLLAAHTRQMLSLAAGALLATALLHLMPEALNSERSAHELFAVLLAGLVFFFLLDKAELWHHGHEHCRTETHAHHHHGEHAHGHHHQDEHERPRAGGWSVVLGDSVHCFGDGVVIAAAFVADVRLGVAASLAVLAHEIPHHVGDLAVVRATAKVAVAGSVTVLGGVLGLLFAQALRDYMPFFLVVGASSFIYVALADLIPQLQQRLDARETTAQVLWLGSGIAAVAVATRLAH